MTKLIQRASKQRSVGTKLIKIYHRLHIHKGWSTAIAEYISITVQQGSIHCTLPSCNELVKVIEKARIQIEGAVSYLFHIGIQASGINDIQIHP